jgi:hypothetical protein
MTRNFPVSLLLLALGLLLARPASAVLRPPALESPPDTLDLLPRDARDFKFSRLAGHDLHQAGFYLGLASVPAVLLAPYAFDLAGGESPLRGPDDAALFLSFVALPAASALMASGNRVYARSARYHTEREFEITKSIIPLLAFTLAAGKSYWYFTQADIHDSGIFRNGLLIGFALTEAFTMPALRGQYRSASAFLDQVEVRVIGSGAGIGLRIPLAGL